MPFRRKRSQGTRADVNAKLSGVVLVSAQAPDTVIVQSMSALRGVSVWVFLLGLGMVGCAGRHTPGDRISSLGEALFNGRVKTDVTCYRCHDGGGTGTLRGPNLARRVPKLTDEEIVTAIQEGPGFMPSFRGKIDDAEMKALTGWLRGRFPKTNEPEEVWYP